MTETRPGPWPETDLAQSPNPSLGLLDPDTRREWSKAIAWLREQSGNTDPFLFARELRDHMHRFEADIAPSCRNVLGNAFLWTDDEREFLEWTKDAFHGLARSAAGALRHEAAHDLLLDESGGTLAALMLTACGNTIKWSEIASAGHDPVSLGELRRVHELAERAGLGPQHFVVPREEHGASVTLDLLFIRAVLLDAICRGNLEPRQVEIVDGWLWEWAGDYVFSDSDQGAVLPLEPGPPKKGLRAPRDEAARRRYVRIDALEDQIRLVTDAFRRGEIYPGHGILTTFRVEEHVVALDFLRRFLDACRYRRARESRTGREEKLEAFVGLGEILRRAFAPRANPHAPARTGAEPAPAAGQQLPVIDSVYDIPRRYMRVLDESADGIGVEVKDDPARPVTVGTVVTLHREDDSPPVLCEVMRRSIVQGGMVRLGLRLLSRAPKKVDLAQPANGVAVAAIYVPSEDASGHVDALLVSETDFKPREDFEVRFSDRVFVVRMNRVRYHGRGWHLAGFEVHEERAVTP
jgi:hypothetical protein